nr:unnamed protein product [Callosobruchus chinensis]
MRKGYIYVEHSETLETQSWFECQWQCGSLRDEAISKTRRQAFHNFKVKFLFDKNVYD